MAKRKQRELSRHGEPIPDEVRAYLSATKLPGERPVMTPAIREYFRSIAGTGGKLARSRQTPEERSELARRLNARRWSPEGRAEAAKKKAEQETT